MKVFFMIVCLLQLSVFACTTQIPMTRSEERLVVGAALIQCHLRRSFLHKISSRVWGKEVVLKRPVAESALEFAHVKSVERRMDVLVCLYLKTFCCI